MKIGFYKDEDEGSKTKGLYWLVVNGHGPLGFTEAEFQEALQIAKMVGFAGHATLRDWLKHHAPSFYAQAITDPDPQGVVIKLLQLLQKHQGPFQPEEID
jgi:hypothetical protein